MDLDFKKILNEGITIYSSGTTGESKPFFQSPSKIKAANEVSRKVHEITKDSRIYTVMKLSHAGGLFAQTIPAFEINAKVDIEKFGVKTFIRNIKNYTHSSFVPLHAKMLMACKEFHNIDLSGVTISCGSEPVTWDIIEAFVSKGCRFILVWGMSEIGPFAITHTFTSMNEVMKIKSLCPENSTLLGSEKHCDYKIENEELIVKGDICIFDDWYYTKDKVIEKDGFLWYIGRVNKEIDFNNPTKGL